MNHIPYESNKHSLVRKIGISAKDTPARKKKILFIASHLPRKCGIATFTRDISEAIGQADRQYICEYIAINDDDSEYEYPENVKGVLRQHDIDSYKKVVEFINASDYAYVILEHEFGLYGGIDGNYILELVTNIQKKLISCLHTILISPDTNKRVITRKIVEHSDKVIVMAHSGKAILKETYGCDISNIVVIPHGVPTLPEKKSQRQIRKELGMVAKHIILISGLLHKDKGIEYAIQAMPAILERHPDTQLYIVGQTHPAQIAKGVDAYRDMLHGLVEQHNLTDHVVFVNRYLTLPELVSYFQASDITITPYLGAEQITSGTLSYALGAGNVCISTPYIHAKEVLAHDRGLFIQFKDSASIAKSVTKVLDSPVTMQNLKQNAYAFGSQLQWPEIAKQYINLFTSQKQYRFDI